MSLWVSLCQESGIPKPGSKSGALGLSGRSIGSLSEELLSSDSSSSSFLG